MAFEKSLRARRLVEKGRERKNLAMRTWYVEEHVEEVSPIVMNIGMSSRITNYFRASKDDTEESDRVKTTRKRRNSETTIIIMTQIARIAQLTPIPRKKARQVLPQQRRVLTVATWELENRPDDYDASTRAVSAFVRASDDRSDRPGCATAMDETKSALCMRVYCDHSTIFTGPPGTKQKRNLIEHKMLLLLVLVLRHAGARKSLLISPDRTQLNVAEKRRRVSVRSRAAEP